MCKFSVISYKRVQCEEKAGHCTHHRACRVCRKAGFTTCCTTHVVAVQIGGDERYTGRARDGGEEDDKGAGDKYLRS